MVELFAAAKLLVVLLVSVGIGVGIKSLLPERHRSRDTIDLLQLVIGMLVTLASVVLGLLTYSVKGQFDTASADLARLGSNLIQTDRMLREYGPETDTARALLRDYTASMIANTWRTEPPPPGDYYPRNLPRTAPGRLESSVLGTLLDDAELKTRQLMPTDAFHTRLASDALREMDGVITARWRLIEDARSTITLPFYLVLSFWLAVVFGCFGLMMQHRNPLVLAMVTLAAIAIASAMFVVLDMDTPFGGFIAIGSMPMRDALAHLAP